jgi:hypothetical protein
MIIATAGPATLAARTASKLPAGTDPGPCVAVVCPAVPEGCGAGLAFAVAPP